ncbi:MAG TPA: extracellular solute-binding protein [Chloroflexota bacterium]|jgi:ABC-type Fe3+ transport system substrate-binding protein|nr:extracellular solute-binding protein [Chloroflexota bacterium]
MDSVPGAIVTRRSMLRIVMLGASAALASACAPATAPPPPTTAPAAPTAAPANPTAAPAAAAPTSAPAVAKTAAAPVFSDADWNALIAAARQEGKFLIGTYAGTGYRKVVDAFQETFSGISVEQTQFQSSSRDFEPRLLQEMKAGIKSWDVFLMPPQEQLRQTRPAGGLDPIRPLIVRPDVLSDDAWIDGFEAGFPDVEKRWGYGITLSKSQALWINTDLVKQGEITRVQDLLDPRWKGQIIAADPRTKGSGFSPAMVMRLKLHDDDIIRKLYKDQEAVLTTDARQPTEAMARGKYALALGAVDIHILDDLRSQGLGNNVQPVSLNDLEYVSWSFNAMFVTKDPPHPNAAKLFVNWALTRDAGVLWAQNLIDNSRRADVPVQDPATEVKRGQTFINIEHEDMLEETEKTQNIAKDVLN